MRFPRKVNYCLLFVLVLVTVVFRYPVFDHEMGADTTFIHSLANSLIEEGRAVWILHPSSIFGFYAISYPSALPFVLGAGNEVAGISIEGIIMIVGLVFAIAGVISAYLVAKLIRDNDIFAHLVALFLTMAPFLVKDTAWIASSRGYVVELFPFLLLLLIKHMMTKDLRYLVLSIATFIVMSATHRMGTLSVMIFTAYIFAIPLHLITQRLRFSMTGLEKPMRYIIVTTALIAFLGVFYAQFQFPGISGANVVEQYSNGLLFRGRSFPILLANMAISSVGRVGLILPLSILGVVAYVWKRPKESYDKFLLLAILLFLPLLSLRDYIIEFLTPLLVLLAIIGFLSLVSTLRSKRQLVTVVVAAIVVSGGAFSWVMKDHWRRTYPTDGPIPDSVYDAALYLKEMAWGTVATNAGLTGGRLAAISRMPNMPLGGASTHFFSAQQLMWGFVEPEDLKVRLLDLTTVSLNTDEIYVPVGLKNTYDDWVVIMSYRVPAAAEYEMNYYNVHFIVAENEFFPIYLSYGVQRPSCLFGDDALPHGDPYKFCVSTSDFLPNGRYVTFSNSVLTIWMARGGSPF